MTGFSRLAIADRGGPAIRCLAAVADLNAQSHEPVTTIALHCRRDGAAWFVRTADESFELAAATPTDVTVDAVLSAVRAVRADAVWVGWGRMASSLELRSRCAAAGIVLVGPGSADDGALPDDVTVKRVADRLGIATVPWRAVTPGDIEAGVAAADSLGYPVLIRPAERTCRALRLVTSANDVPDAMASVAAECSAVDGTGQLVFERWVRHARQVEVQVIADRFGTVWSLGVRDSSVQRRREKVLQESRCTSVDEAVEARLREATAAFSKAVHYTGAGAADFLVDLETGEALFRSFHPRLQAGHPVTEATTGVDLVALTLQVAQGLPLPEPLAPRQTGHAIGVRILATDPEHGFGPAGGRLSLLRLPVGGGIRVDTGYTEGDVIDAVADPLLATLVASGHNRDEALARLRRALAQLIVVIDGGTTTKSVLASELASPSLCDGSYDCAWLDGLIAIGAHLPAPDPLAVLAAAVQVYEIEEGVVREQFLATAARGRPSLPEASGHRVDLRLRGHSYRLHVFEVAPSRYRVDVEAGTVELGIAQLSRYERAMTCAGRNHRVVVATDGGRLHVEVDGVPHVVERDDGVVVRTPAPAFVVEAKATVGAHVRRGDPLIALESMKMLTTVTAPVDGVVSEVMAGVHTQVDVGASLVRIRPERQETSEGVAADFTQLLGSGPVDVRAQLRGYLLGFDVDDVARQALLDLAHSISDIAAGTADELSDELDLIEIFTDLCALSRREPDSDPDADERVASPQEHLFTYLSRLDPNDTTVPAAYRDRLRQSLARLGVSSLARSAELERAVVRLYRSFLRSKQVTPVVAAVLDRWLRDGRVLAARSDDRLRTALARLVHVAPGRADAVADLAREVFYRFVDEPVLAKESAAADAGVNGWIDDLLDGADEQRVAVAMAELVACPRPLRNRLRDAYLRAADQVGRDRLLETRTRRFYRARDLEGVRSLQPGRHRVCTAHHSGRSGRTDIVCGYLPLSELADLLRSLALASDAFPEDARIVVDVETWSEQARSSADELSERLRIDLAAAVAVRGLHRIDITVTSAGDGPEHLRTQHVTLRPAAGGLTEDRSFRNLHPMIAKRLELSRWSEFDLVRLASAEDVYAFTATARSNRDDVRILAIAEVRDLTPAPAGAAEGARFPLLERMLCEALTTVRHTVSGYPPRKRPLHNHVVLHVRPSWHVPSGTLRELAHRLAPMTTGLGLEKVSVRVSMADAAGGPPRPAVIDIGGEPHGVTVRVHPPSTEPVPPMTAYDQRVLKAARAGAPYPYELVTMLTPPPDAPSDFPTGRWVEYDVDAASSTLVPVDRAPGLNTCGIVCGVITTFTTTVPEGMSRVALLGDPTRGLGNLAEAECRRIIAALDLAERMHVPLEWYALSSGARIAMDSGTENMDWISAVLRRLIEFTQSDGEVNIVVTGINVGAQPYWNAEATMLMHTRGVLVMTPSSAMVLTGKSSLDYSGGVSAEDNAGIGGFERVMGPNGQGQYWAPTLADACALLLRHYDFTYVVPGESGPRRTTTTDPADRDVRTSAHQRVPDCEFDVVGDVFSADRNPDRKHPFDMRSVMRAVADADCEPLERWGRWRDAETAIVWDARVGGLPVCLLGIESRPLPRSRFMPADGPPSWTSGTLFPQSSRKLARAINSASGNRPLVVLANLSGFDGSPESMRKWQLEYGAEIGRAVTNFRGPVVFVVVSRYHGGAFVVFSKQLNDNMEIAAVEGSYASVIGGAPAAAVVFAREVGSRTDQDPRVVSARERLAAAAGDDIVELRREVAALLATVHAEKLKEVADEFDAIHDIRRAQRVGSVDLIVPAAELRPYVIGAVERGLARAASLSPPLSVHLPPLDTVTPV